MAMGKYIALIAPLTLALMPAPTMASDGDLTAEEVAKTVKSCKALKGKAAKDPAKLESCHIAGQQYGQAGNAVARDGKLSEQYLAKACNGGLGKSCSLLSWYYLDNSAYESSSEKSRFWDEKGCEANDASACAGVGYWLAEDGDVEAAKAHYRRAIELKPDYQYAKDKLAKLEG